MATMLPTIQIHQPSYRASARLFAFSSLMVLCSSDELAQAAEEVRQRDPEDVGQDPDEQQQEDHGDDDPDDARPTARAQAATARRPRRRVLLGVGVVDRDRYEDDEDR